MSLDILSLRRVSPPTVVTLKLTARSTMLLSLNFAKVYMNPMPLGIDHAKYEGAFGTNNYAFHWMPNKNSK